MSQNNKIYVSRNTSGLDIAADETIIFQVRASLLLLFAQIVVLFMAGGVVSWIFVKFKFAQSIGMEKYAFWVNMVPYIVVVLVIIVVFIRWMTTIYTLTTKRLQISVNFIYSYDQSIALDHVESVKMERSIFGFMLNFGNIIIKSAAANFQLVFGGISSPKKYLDIIKDNL